MARDRSGSLYVAEHERACRLEAGGMRGLHDTQPLGRAQLVWADHLPHLPHGICMCLWMYVWMYGCMDARRYDVWMNVCVYVCVYVCMYVCVCARMYVVVRRSGTARRIEGEQGKVRDRYRQIQIE